MEVDPDFFVDFHDRPGGPARAHRGAPPGRRLHNRDLPVSVIAHVGGLPLEEGLLAVAPAASVFAVLVGARLRGLGRRLRRPWPD
jgi:hypothetical protein